MEITPSTVVRFHPLFIRKGSAGIYYVTRWGGKSRVATRSEGIAAIRALRSGHPTGEVQKSIDPDARGLSLQPLLQALMTANLIRTVDGLPVSQREFNLFTFLKSLFRFYLLPHYFAAIRSCPVAMRRWCIGMITALSAYHSLSRRAAIAEQNVRNTALTVSRRFHAQYFFHLLWNIADTDAIFGSPTAEARRWLDRHVQWKGLENLEKAGSLGVGVICAGFHFTASRLVAPLLLSRGYNVHLTATSSPSVDVADSERWHNEIQSLDPQAGRFRQILQVNLASVKELLGALSRSEVVLTFPDMHTIDPNSDEKTRERCAFFGIARGSFRAPNVTVEIAGVQARMNEWAGWLAAQSSAPVVPVMLVRAGNGRLIINIEPPIMPSITQNLADRANAVNEELFRTLDRHIRARPAQWFGWHRFHFQRVCR
jgi:lauroyl/myristoyl acyltransferase